MKHYDTLDSLRGVAALAVVVFHLGSVGLTGDLAPHGYLAVDFFFELSGFVLALAYRNKLAASMHFGDFVAKRAIRIYPLAFAGIALGILTEVAQFVKQSGGGVTFSEVAISGILNLLLIPSPVSSSSSFYALYPGNAAIWSLFLEIVINIAWAGALWRLTKAPLLLLCALSAFWLGAQMFAHGDANLGSSWLTVWGGIARVCFGFLLGTLIEVAKWRLPAPSSPRFGIVLGGVLLILMFAPNVHEATPYFDLACIIVIFPLVLLCGMTQSKGGKFSLLLGQLSYPLYALHFPLLIVARLFSRSAAGHIPIAVFCTAAVVG